jgi:hypothetical protein
MVRIQSTDGTTTKLEWFAFCPGGISAAQAASSIIGAIIEDVMKVSNALADIEAALDSVLMAPEGRGILFSYSANIKPLEGQGLVTDKLRELRFILKS